MKTPDEIKKCLGRCLDRWTPVHFVSCESDCPYHSEGAGCKNAMHSDVIAYIQQLEAGIDHAEKVTRECAKSITENMDKLQSRLIQVERGRDAAVAEIKRMENKAKELFETEIHDVILRELPYSDYMDFINQVEQICNYQFENEWRDVCSENTKEPSE